MTNLLMPESIYQYGDYQKDASYEHLVPRSLSGRHKGYGSIVSSELFQTNFGPIGCSSTVRSWGVGGSNNAIQFDSKTNYFIDMNISGLVSSWSSGSPCAHSKFFSFDGHGPLGLEFANVSPTDDDFFRRISYYDPFITESDLGMNQKYINEVKNEERKKNACNFTGYTTLVESRPNEEKAEHDSDSSKDEIGFWSVNFNVGHASILSQQASKRDKAIR